MDLGVVVAYGRSSRPRCSSPCHGEPPLLAAPPGGGPPPSSGRSSPATRHRRGPDGRRGGARHRRDLRPHRDRDRARRPARGAASPSRRRGRPASRRGLWPGSASPGRRRASRAMRPRSMRPSGSSTVAAGGRRAPPVRVGDAWTTFQGKRLKVLRTAVPPVGDVPGPCGRRPRGAPGRATGGQARDGRRGVGQGAPGRRASGCPREHPSRRGSGPVTARVVGPRCPDRIDPGGAYANLLLPELLDRTGLAPRPPLRHGARLWHHPDAPGLRPLVDRFLPRTVEPPVRNAAAPRRLPAPPPGHGPPRRGGRDRRGGATAGPRAGERRAAPGGRQPGHLARRSHPPQLPGLGRGAPDRRPRRRRRPGRPRRHEHRPAGHRGEDGYVQDLASQWVAAAVDGGPGGAGRRPLRRARRQGPCLAATGAAVVAADLRPGRAALVRVQRPWTHGAAGRGRRRHRAPVRAGSFDHVLVDAAGAGSGRAPPPPGCALADRCRGRGAARGGPARAGRGGPDAGPPRGASSSTRCAPSSTRRAPASTPTSRQRAPELTPGPGSRRPGARRSGARLLPQDADTDGMYVLRMRVPSSS